MVVVGGRERQKITFTVSPCLCLILLAASKQCLIRISCKQKSTRTIPVRVLTSGGELGTRTPDPLRVMQVL